MPWEKICLAAQPGVHKKYLSKLVQCDCRYWAGLLASSRTIRRFSVPVHSPSVFSELGSAVSDLVQTEIAACSRLLWQRCLLSGYAGLPGTTPILVVTRLSHLVALHNTRGEARTGGGRSSQLAAEAGRVSRVLDTIFTYLHPA